MLLRRPCMVKRLSRLKRTGQTRRNNLCGLLSSTSPHQVCVVFAKEHMLFVRGLKMTRSLLKLKISRVDFGIKENLLNLVIIIMIKFGIILLVYPIQDIKFWGILP